MGCGASKSNNHPNKDLPINNHNVAGINPNNPQVRDSLQQDHKPNIAADWQNLISNDNLKEGSLHNIDNNLWRDTKNEVAIYNAKEAVDI